MRKTQEPEFSQMELEQERWKDVPTMEGYYQVSNLGRVRSKDRIVRHNCGGDKKVKGQMLSRSKNGNGYYYVHLYKEGNRKMFLVHRMVLLAFVGECPPNMEVRHLNSVPTDNRLQNLAYGTHSENTIDTINLGRNSRQKFNPTIVKEIRQKSASGMSNKALAAEYKTSVEAISKIKRHVTYAWI